MLHTGCIKKQLVVRVGFVCLFVCFGFFFYLFFIIIFFFTQFGQITKLGTPLKGST